MDNPEIVKIGDICDSILQGCTIGGDGGEKIFVVDEDDLRKNELEIELCKKVIKGRDVLRWGITWQNRYIIYPYNDEGKLLDLCNYPKSLTYLNQYKEKLSNRILDGKNIKDWNKEWYSLWRERQPQTFLSEKIVTPRISTHNRFALDECNKFFLLDSCVALSFKQNIDKKLVLGLLNSNISQFIISKISPFVQGRYFNYSQIYLERIPIKLPRSENDQTLSSSISECVNKIIQFTSIKQKIDDFPSSYLKNKKYTELQEIAISFNSKITISEMTIKDEENGGHSILLHKKIKPILCETRLATQYITTFLKDKTFKKGDEYTISIPKDVKDIDIVMNELETDLKLVKDFNEESVELQMNTLVYQYYGISPDEATVIESGSVPNCL